MSEVKICACCKVEKLVSEFGVDNSKASGRKSSCSVCLATKLKE